MHSTRKPQPLKKSIWGALLALLLILSPTWSLAHSMHVFAYIEGDQIKGEGAYGDGSPVSGGVVTIHDAGKRLIGKGQTSAEGSFSLALKPGRSPLLVEIKDGGGHAGSFTLGREESAPAAPLEDKAGKTQAPAAVPGKAVAEPVQHDEMARMLRKELAPIKAQLARLASQKTISLADVVGGLGWIVGLAGLALWLKSRKR